MKRPCKFLDTSAVHSSQSSPIQSYLTDSLVNRIYAYDYNDGKLSNRRDFVNALELGLPERTYPDGLCIDSEGGIWSAR